MTRPGEATLPATATLRNVHVSIRLFAGLRERAGTGARELELSEGACVADVWSALDLGSEPSGLLYAVNKSYAAAGSALAEGDEVALIPPVSGGDFKLSEAPLSLDSAVREVARDEAGAVATFLGTVRTARATAPCSTSSTRPTRGWRRT